MRKKLYEIIEPLGDGGILSSFYDYLIMVTIVVSMIPLAFKETNTVFQWMEYVTVGIFILDYLLRLLTADFKLKKGALSFLFYPITPMALIDLLSILPSVTMLHSGFKLLKLFRLMRTFNPSARQCGCFRPRSAVLRSHGAHAHGQAHTRYPEQHTRRFSSAADPC